MKLPRTVAIVDYGMGNLRSVDQAVKQAAQDQSTDVIITADPDSIRKADRVILPGQGAMRDCMRELRERHAGALLEAVLEAARQKPLMGVCVGMQMLLDHSEEQDTPALGLIPGQVVRFQLDGQLQADGSRYKIPQMGWNRVHQTLQMKGKAHYIWTDIPDQSFFYFVHSYFAKLHNPSYSAGETDYGGLFTCVIARDNIFSTQFHPEKSAQYGLLLYRNFLSWQP